MQMTYDTARGGFVSVKSPLDDYFADFVITPEEFPQYDVENSKWLGTIDGVVAVDGQKQLLEHIFKKEAASYTIDENKIRADELIKTIKEEHYTSEPSTSDG